MSHVPSTSCALSSKPTSRLCCSCESARCTLHMRALVSPLCSCHVCISLILQRVCVVVRVSAPAVNRVLMNSSNVQCVCVCVVNGTINSERVKRNRGRDHMLHLSWLCLLADCVTTLKKLVPEAFWLSAFELQTQQFSELCALSKSGRTQWNSRIGALKSHSQFFSENVCFSKYQ